MGRNGLKWTIIYEKSTWDETVSNSEYSLEQIEIFRKLLHWQESFIR